jgi:hypothetical protein
MAPKKNKSQDNEDRRGLILFLILFLPTTWIEWLIVNVFTPIGDFQGIVEFLNSISSPKDPYAILYLVIVFLVNIVIMNAVTEKIKEWLGW